jgi:hypothetical protein
MRPAVHDKPPFRVRWRRNSVRGTQDVGLVAQHVLGTLRAASAGNPAQQRKPGPGVATTGRAQKTAAPAVTPELSVAETAATAARPYVFEHAAQFGRELAAFAASGLSMAAHDCLVFAPADSAPGSAEGEGKGAPGPGCIRPCSPPPQTHRWPEAASQNHPPCAPRSTEPTVGRRHMLPLTPTEGS